MMLDSLLERDLAWSEQVAVGAAACSAARMPPEQGAAFALGAQGRIEPYRGHADAVQAALLVAHERDER